MRTFYKWMAKVAERGLAKEDVKQAPISILNQLHALDGAVATHFEVHSTGLVQRMNDIVSRYTSDLGVIFNDIVKDRLDNVKLFISQSERNVEKRVAGVEGELHSLKEKGASRHNMTMRCFEELSRELALKDQSDSERYLQQYNLNNHWHVLNNNTIVRLFKNLTEQIESLRVPQEKQRYDSGPDLGWLIDNVDDIIDAATELKALRDNTAPRNSVMLRAIRAIRQLKLFSITDIREELEAVVSRWDNDQMSMAA